MEATTGQKLKKRTGSARLVLDGAVLFSKYPTGAYIISPVALY